MKISISSKFSSVMTQSLFHFFSIYIYIYNIYVYIYIYIYVYICYVYIYSIFQARFIKGASWSPNHGSCLSVPFKYALHICTSMRNKTLRITLWFIVSVPSPLLFLRGFFFTCISHDLRISQVLLHALTFYTFTNILFYFAHSHYVSFYNLVMRLFSLNIS